MTKLCALKSAGASGFVEFLRKEDRFRSQLRSDLPFHPASMELAAELGHEHSQIVSVILKHSPKIPLGRRLSASVFRRASSCPSDLELQRKLVDLAQGAVHGMILTQYRSKAAFYRAQPRSQGPAPSNVTTAPEATTS